MLFISVELLQELVGLVHLSHFLLGPTGVRVGFEGDIAIGLTNLSKGETVPG